MKSTTFGIAGWLGRAGLMAALGMIGSFGALAQDHPTLSFRHADQQAPSAASNTDLPVVTPELQADMLVVHGRYRDAIDAYSKIQPLTAEIYNKIGIAYQRLGMDQNAIDSYDRAARMDHKFAAVYNNLGTIYFRQDDMKRAQRYYKRSIRLDGQMAPFWSNLGAVYLAQKKYSDGAEAYERAFNLDPDIFRELELNGLHKEETPAELATMYICFAEIYAHAGMKVQAIDYLQKALLEGFKNRQQLQQNQQLASLRGTLEFEHLLAGNPKQ